LENALSLSRSLAIPAILALLILFASGLHAQYYNTPGQILQLSPADPSGAVWLPFAANGFTSTVTDILGNTPPSGTIAFTNVAANPNELAVAVNGGSLPDKTTVFFADITDFSLTYNAYFVIVFSYGTGPVAFLNPSTNQVYPNNRIALTRMESQVFPNVGPINGTQFELCAGSLYTWVATGSKFNCNNGSGQAEYVGAGWLNLALQPWMLVSPTQAVVATLPAYFPPGFYEGYAMMLDPTGQHVLAFAEVDYWNYNSLSLPHFAAGGSYVTDFTIVNTGASPANFNIAFYGDNGQAVSIPVSGANNQSSISGAVPGGQLQFFEVGNSSFPLTGGWAQVTADPSITIETLFRNIGSDGNYYEASVPVELSSTEILIPYDATIFAPTGAQTYTGFALANNDPNNPATITCEATNSNGAVVPHWGTGPTTCSPL
jgi:hypothetical protein